ncbi:MAG: hypothetical protein AAGI24_11990 [Pseudomonadota bacterium]
MGLLISQLTGCAKQLGFDIATGYAAKQLCSGVFVAGLPEDHLMAYDVEQTLSPLGPLQSLLSVTVDREQRQVDASFLGTTSQAYYTGPTGCVLHGMKYAALDARPFAAVDSITARAPEPDTFLAGLEPALDNAFSEPAKRSAENTGSAG